MRVPAAWATDLQVLRLGGSVLEDRGDHVVVRTPRNPGFRWGNFLLVTDPCSVRQARRWVETFDAQFPDAGYLAIGLPARPDPQPWAQLGVALEHEVVLARSSPPPPVVLPVEYVVRRLESAGDWAEAVAADLRDVASAGRPPSPEHVLFVHRAAELRAQMCRTGSAAFFGAFSEPGLLVARLGVVLCGPVDRARQVARYQHVATDERHRRRGLAGHLLAVAGDWAAVRGADHWEIHADPGSEGHRRYARAGFSPRGGLWQAVQGPQA